MSSSWWPVPARASTWFSPEQLAESKRYHKPLQRVAVARTMARFAGLLGACWFGDWWLSGSTSSGSIRSGGHVGDLGSLVVICGVLTLAFWVPATMSDWWFDQIHEPHFGSDPLPPRRLVVGSVVSGLVLFAGLVGLGLVVSLVVNATQYWFVVLPVIVTGCGSVAALLGHQVAMRARSLIALDTEVLAQLPFGDLPLGGIDLRLMDDRIETGWNALSTNIDGQATIAMTASLLEAPPEVRRLIVAHELGHLQHGHLGQMLWIGLIQAGLLGLGTSWLLAPWGLGLLNVDAPTAGLPVVVLVSWILAGTLGLGSAWSDRAHERQADAVAFELAQPMTLDSMRAVHATGRADLAPGLLSRLTSSHPPPAERLHRFSVRPTG